MAINPGVKLKTERLNRGLGVETLAELAGVTPRVIRYAEETGRRPHPENAKLVADYLGMQVTDIWPVESESEAAA